MTAVVNNKLSGRIQLVGDIWQETAEETSEKKHLEGGIWEQTSEVTHLGSWGNLMGV